ncbi:triacylglycerol lipase [Roseisolibacter sp. H3M3-2]|uniref:esterase/lipase family protein n=1 Tax=Roseisolibacter sp. H3M3-2 TaxID=3031323 RepID=UPI0023D9AC5D|nr:triacylglycerol lipase [Roseisolibacter sp. H3M3-2]MDF1503106.1 triacylglycerol lipase [Roseisolibacter sp. H3M3-2]
MRLHRTLAAAGVLAAAACSDPARLLGPGGRDDARRPTRPARNPILFVHGWNSSGGIWGTMTSRFQKDGWKATELATFSYPTAQSNATTAALIGQKVDSILAATGATQVDVVTHSMGALSARYYLRNLGGDAKVDALVSLGGPNHGTNTAWFCGQTACVEMRPGSAFLTALNATDETWGAPRYGTWWTSCDQVINPATSTPLDGAANTQTACMQHSDLYADSRVYAQVRDFVAAAPSATLALALP